LAYGGVHCGRAHQYRGSSPSARQRLHVEPGATIVVPGRNDSNSAVTGVAHGSCRATFAFPALGRRALRQFACASPPCAVDRQGNSSQGGRENYTATCHPNLRTRVRQRGSKKGKKGRRVAGVTGGSVSAGGLTRLLALYAPKSSSVRLGGLPGGARRGSDSAEHAGKILCVLLLLR
jgi:hypothetical protein